MLLKPLSVFLFALLFSFQLIAQDKIPIKFGHVSEEDFDISKFNVDTSNGAVIIADVGITTFEGNNEGRFSLVYKRQRRIKIINKNGFSLANVEVPLYVENIDEEKLDDIKGTTYNIEDGKVVATNLKSDAIFKDKSDRNHIIKKFTLPSVKEGSIIEYSYTVTSEFLGNLRPWSFQGEYPRVWSEYETIIPEYFQYIFLSQGYQSFDIDTIKESMESYTMAMAADNIAMFSGRTFDHRWVMKNVPALKEEKFISTLDNHIAKIEFQLQGIQFPNRPYKDIMGSWNTVSDDLLKDDYFGAELDRRNGWLDDAVSTAIAGATTSLDKARKIFYYVKNNIKSTDQRGIYLTKSIRDVFKDKSGSVADVNMLLTAMMKFENIDAAPVILSTRDNGYTHEIYPLLGRYNYVICKISIDNTDYYLDATQANLGFARLANNCYNGQARIISEPPAAVIFSPDSLEESKVTNVILSSDSTSPGKWVGDYSSNLGYYESCDIRDKIVEKGKTDFEKDLTSSYTGEYSISDIKLVDLDNDEKPIQENYKLDIQSDNPGDIIYFDPMIKDGYAENYFKSSERTYPVEMPYLIDETYTLNVDVPDGYEVDELPKSVKVLLNDTDGFFEYLVSSGDGIINMRSRIKLNRATFLPEDYQSLRDFFDYVVKKHSEQFVFKKKK